MLTTIASALLATITVQAAPPAQPQAAPAAPQAVTPPPEFMASAQAYGQCIGAAAQALPATVTPEAGAKQAAAGCTTQRTALETRFEAWITGPGFPEAGRATAREQFRTQMAGVETQLADGIRTARATPAPAATPAPTPTR